MPGFRGRLRAPAKESEPLRVHRVLRCLTLTLALFLSACGEPNRNAVPPLPTFTPSLPTSASPTPSPTSTTWQTYSNSTFGFSIDRPGNFSVAEATTTAKRGLLLTLRFFDAAYADRYPPGQVLIHVYEKDSDSLRDWVEKHSGPLPASPNPDFYFYGVEDLTDTTAVGRPAVTFTIPPSEAGRITHLTFFAHERVVSVSWHADDANYESTIQDVFDRMLASYQD